MAGKTPRFALNYFGGANTPGTILDDGQKFTGLDRLVIDRLFAAIETHDHRYRPVVASNPAAPTGTLVRGGGRLTAGQTYHYRYGVIDAQGNETLASLELAVATPTPLPAPGMPALTSDLEAMGVTGPAATGTLRSGYYYYAVTGLRGDEESPIGAATMISLVEGEGAVHLTMPALGNAEAFSVWRMGSLDVGYTRIGNTTTTTFVDNGAVAADPCACDPGVAAPQTNTGVSNFAVTVTLPTGVDLTTARGWRLYRSTTAGIYGAQSLVHETVERTDEWNPAAPLLRAWTDNGGQLAVGQPMTTDQNMRFSPLTLDSRATAPAVTGYPDYYPMVIGGVLRIKLGTAWVGVEQAITIPRVDDAPAVTAYAEGAPLVIDGELHQRVGNAWVSIAPVPPTPVAEAAVMTSPNGNRWVLTVDDTGALATQATALAGPPARAVVTVAAGATPAVNWTDVQTGGTPVTGWRVRYVVDGTMMQAELAAAVRTYALPSGYTGNVWVTARNAIGESVPAQVTV